MGVGPARAQDLSEQKFFAPLFFKKAAFLLKKIKQRRKRQ
jgi:hypothetical protein